MVFNDRHSQNRKIDQKIRIQVVTWTRQLSDFRSAFVKLMCRAGRHFLGRGAVFEKMQSASPQRPGLTKFMRSATHPRCYEVGAR